MKQHKNTIEIDFTDQIRQSKAVEEPETKDCGNESCENDCACSEESEAQLTDKQKKLPPALQKAIMKRAGKKPKNGDKENGDKENGDKENGDKKEDKDSKAEHKAGHDKKKKKKMSYAELYQKVKAADPQRDPDKHKVDIKTKHESARKIEDHPTAEELREVDEPLGKKGNYDV